MDRCSAAMLRPCYHRFTNSSVFVINALQRPAMVLYAKRSIVMLTDSPWDAMQSQTRNRGRGNL